MNKGRWNCGAEIRTDYIVVPGPDVDVDHVQDGEEREPPANAVNDDLLATFEELVDDCSEKEKVDERPAGDVQESEEWNNERVRTR